MINKNYEFAKDVAFYRHTQTIYNKNLDLMYDENGNQTELRKRLNYIIAKVNRGELPYSFIKAMNSEIKWARTLKNHNGSPFSKKGKKKKIPQPKSEKQILKEIQDAQNAMVKRQNQMLHRINCYIENKQVLKTIAWLNQQYKKAIGIHKTQLKKYKNRLLPYYPDNT